jgi:hypothetical protein
MAYVPQQNPYNDEQVMQSQQNAADMVQGASAPAAPATQQASQPASTTQPVNKGGSSFPDISRFLSQNKPQANRLASRIGNQYLGQANQGAQQLGNIRGQFNTAVNASRVPFNQDIANRFSNDLRSFWNFPTASTPYQPGPGGKKNKGNQDQTIYRANGNGKNKGPSQVQPDLNTPADQAPVGITPTSQADLDAFIAMRDANYTGPTDITQQEGYGDAIANLQAGNKFSNFANDSSAINDELNKFAGPGYSSGASALDNLLLGSSGDAQGILGQASDQIKQMGIPEMIGGLPAESNEFANAAREETDATRGQISSLADAELGELRDLYGSKKSKKIRPQLDQTLEALNMLMGTEYTI